MTSRKLIEAVISVRSTRPKPRPSRLIWTSSVSCCCSCIRFHVLTPLLPHSPADDWGQHEQLRLGRPWRQRLESHLPSPRVTGADGQVAPRGRPQNLLQQELFKWVAHHLECVATLSFLIKTSSCNLYNTVVFGAASRYGSGRIYTGSA